MKQINDIKNKVPTYEEWLLDVRKEIENIKLNASSEQIENLNIDF